MLISAGDYSATIITRGAGLAALTYRGRDVVVPHPPQEDPRAYSGKVLVPWPNRVSNATYSWRGETYVLEVNEPVTGSALHGLKCWAEWDVAELKPELVRLETIIHPVAGYPFELAVSATYALDPDSGLTIKIEAVNTGQADAPYGVSIHPFLTCGVPVDDCVLTLPASDVLEVDDLLSPIGLESVQGTKLDLRNGASMKGRQIDHAFTGLPEGAWTASLRDPATGREVAIEGSDKWVQIYSGELLDREGVAVEPMTCPPNAFNSGEDVVILKPGDEHFFSARIYAVN